MKHKRSYISILFLWVGIFNFFCTLGQSVSNIPDHPKKVRSLPSNYKENYSGTDFDYIEHVSFWQKFKAWFLEKLIRFFNMGKSDATDTFEVLKFIFFAAILIAVIYYVVKLIINKEGRWLFSKNKEVNQIMDYEEIQNIKEADFKTLIAEAENKEDYRSAIKFYYLYVLKKMDRAEIISFDSQKTSHDYLLLLEGTAHYPDFSKAAYYYTYIWYGEFNIDAEEYQTASSIFITLLKPFTNE